MLMKRTLCFLTMFMATTTLTTVYGQQTTTYRYMARVQPVIPGHSPKPLFSAIDALVPASMFSLDPEKKVLHLETPRELTLVALQNATTPTGFIVLTLERYDRITGERMMQEGDTGELFPVFMDTGDQRADHARYDAAKAAWIATHPEDYARMTSEPFPITPPSNDEE